MSHARDAVILVTALAAACAASRPPAAPSPFVSSTLDPQVTRDLLAALREERDRQRIPALFARIEVRGGGVLRAAVGTRDMKGGHAAGITDCVRVGSVTKLVLAVAALRLVERGVLSLDDPIARWLPALPAASSITVGQLLSHSAGVPDVTGISSLVGATLSPSHVYTKGELLARISSGRAFNAGERFEYSNGNAIALGMVLEQASEKSIRQLFAEEVFARAGTAQTSLLPEDSIPACLLTGYDRDLIPFGHDLEPRDSSFASLAWTSGGLRSTVDDLASVVRGVRDATLVSSASLAQMLPSRPATGKFHEVAVGLGLFRFDFHGRSFVGHEGLFVGSQALAGWTEDDGTLLVLIGNRSSFDLAAIAERLLGGLTSSSR